MPNNQITCPTCKKRFVFDVSLPTMPFCSKRCQLIDLGKWIDEEIGLPHVSLDDEAEDDEGKENQSDTVREWKFD